MQTVFKCPTCGRFLKKGVSCPVHKVKGQQRTVNTTPERKGKTKGSPRVRAPEDHWQPRAGVVCTTCGEGSKEKTGIVKCERFPYLIAPDVAKKGAACRT